MKLKESLKNDLKKEELELVRNSYDVIGNIAILEVSDKLKDKEKLIANRILESNNNIKTVLKKEGIHKGKFRLQDYRFLAGENKTETTYKENNCRFYLDVSKVYFSPRLSNERLRISRLVEKGESVLVMFSGVGVYEIIISKNSSAKEIYGVEINKDAHEYARKNVSLNLVSNVHLFLGDVRDFNINKKFDRIIMPLPREAENFLDVARKFIKDKGMIHFYTFSNEKDIENVDELIKKYFDNFKILNKVKCGNFAPGIFRYCIDFKVG